MMTRHTKITLAIAVTAVVALVATGGQRIVAEKILTRLIMPYGLAWLAATALLLVVINRRDRWLTILAGFVWILIYVAGSSLVSLVLVQSLERQFAGIDRFAEPPFDAVVLLGGGTTTGPNGQSQLQHGGDRAMLAARLFHAGKVNRLICTGSRIPGLDRIGVDQSTLAERLLTGVGVPAGAVEKIGGRTTSEEMGILANMFPSNDRVGLITSAWHMPRALRLANAQGFHPLPIPADFYSRPDMRPRAIDLIPSGRSARTNAVLAKEWLARLVGR